VPKLQKINVVFIYVADLARARDFYENVVGFGKPVMKTKTWVEYSLEAGGTHFALHQSSAEALDGCDRTRNTVKFSIVVDDLQASYEELSAHGVEFTRPPEKGYGFLVAEFLDPEANQLRLLQYTTMKPPA
jgi:predicted enzyme related to lactoylglutathione lyase